MYFPILHPSFMISSYPLRTKSAHHTQLMKRAFFILLYIAVLLPLAAQPRKHEVRAAWFMDWTGLRRVPLRPKASASRKPN